MNTEQLYSYPKVAHPSQYQYPYSYPPQVRTPLREEPVEPAPQPQPKMTKKQKLKATILREGTPAANHPIIKEKLEKAKVDADRYGSSLSCLSVLLSCASIATILFCVSQVFAQKQYQTTLNSKQVMTTVQDTTSYYTPIVLATLVLYKSIQGFSATKTQDIEQLNSTGKKVNVVGAIVLTSCIYQICKNCIPAQTIPQLTNLIQESSGVSSGRAMFEVNLNFNSDDITDYFTQKANQVSDFIGSLAPVPEEKEQPNEEDKDLFEKIDEFADSYDLSDKQKQLIEEFCDRFTKICKAFDLLDEELKLKNMDCHVETEFCEKLHEFLKYVQDKYQELKDLNMKDLAEKAKRKFCETFPSMCKKMVRDCSKSVVNSELEFCSKLKATNDEVNPDSDYSDRKQPSYKQYVKQNEPTSAFEELIRTTQNEAKPEKKVQMELPQIQMPQLNNVVVMSLISFASVLVYLVMFSNYKQALSKHITLKAISENENAIVVTSEKAKEIFEEHEVEHPLVNASKEKKEKKEIKVYTSAHIKELIAEVKGKKQKKGDVESMGFKISESNNMA